MKVSGKDSLGLFQGSPALGLGHTRHLLRQFAKEHNLQFAEGQDPASPDSIPPVPSEGDFMLFPFRHLSACIVGSGSWKASDFSNTAMLQASTQLLRHVPAYTNHNIYVGNEIGHVGDPVWTPAYTNSKGQFVPAGIDAPFAIDKVINPKLVRQLSSPVSPIRAASVTVDFDWEASHDFENSYDFYRHLGELIDGTEVRRVATNIVKYYESSLVWDGADPNARLLVNGEVQLMALHPGANPGKYTDESPELQFYKSAQRKYYIFDGATAQFSNGAGAPPTLPPSPPQPNPMNEALLKFMAQKLGKTVDELRAMTAEQFEAAVAKVQFLSEADATRFAGIGALEASAAQVTTLQGQVTSLTSERDTLATFKKENEGHATVGKQFETDLRATATASYNRFTGGKPDAAITQEIATSTVQQLQAKIKMWDGDTLKQFGATCTKCGNADSITMRATREDETTGGFGRQQQPKGGNRLAQAGRR